jgi:hypothetical protein
MQRRQPIAFMDHGTVRWSLREVRKLLRQQVNLMVNAGNGGLLSEPDPSWEAAVQRRHRAISRKADQEPPLQLTEEDMTAVDHIRRARQNRTAPGVTGHEAQLLGFACPIMRKAVQTTCRLYATPESSRKHGGVSYCNSSPNLGEEESPCTRQTD